MSFHLVDRIHSLRPGTSAIGQFEPPPMEAALSLGLLVEAVGQLAGWVAMHKLSFEQRPVAASAGRVEVHSTASSGGPVDLEVEITSFRHGAISYRGIATVSGEPVLSLERAVGPLLPMAEFDDAARMKDILGQLRRRGLPARPLVSAEDYRPEIRIEDHTDASLSAVLEVPEASAIYVDHFPRRPLYPATLLLDSQILEIQSRFLRPDGTRRAVREVRAVKVRSFSGPGETLHFDANREERGESGPLWFRAETHKDDARVSSMRVALEA